MKIAEQTVWSGWTKRLGIGMTALALAVTFSLPTSVVAKEKKSASKVTVHKKASKKVSKKASKPKALAKHTKISKTTKTSKTAQATKVTKTGKSSKTKVVSNKPSKSVVKRVSYRAKKPAPALVWQPSNDAKQAYYVMPDSLGGDVGKPQQHPDYLKSTDVSKQSSQDQSSQNTSAKKAASGKAHQVGTASYYSDKFDGRKTASGERFDQDNLTCAHGSLPFGCRIRVTNLRNNKAVEVKVNDRGGFNKYGRVIDLSKAAAKEIGMMATGTAKVKVEVLE